MQERVMEEHVMAIQPRPLLGRRRWEDPLDELTPREREVLALLTYCTLELRHTFAGTPHAGTPKGSVTAWAAAA